MKIKTFSIPVLASLLLFAAVTCNMEDQLDFPPESTLTISSGEGLTATATAGVYTINVTSNGAWTAQLSAGADWCTIDEASASGNGNGTISIAVAENISLTPRKTTVTIAVKGSVIKQVSLQQDGAEPLVRIDEPVRNITAAAATYSVNVTGNSTWTATVNAEAQGWCSIAPASGNGSAMLTLGVLNNTGAPRAATVTVSANSTLTAQLTVNQNMETIGLDPISINALATENDYTVAVTTSSPAVTWNAVVNTEAVSWCTVANGNSGAGSGSITLNILENQGATRMAIITVTAESDGFAKQVFITQTAPALTVKSRLDVSAVDSSYNIPVTSNLNWSAQVGAEGAGWCTISAPASGVGNGAMTVTFTENTTGDARAATITVTGGAFTRHIAVKQVKAGESVEGVEIGNIVWATRNVDAPGEFAETPGSKGMFYKYGVPVAYSSDQPYSTIPAGQVWHNTGETTPWDMVNANPCPSGWHVPTAVDCAVLVSFPQRRVIAGAANWNIAGIWVGPDANTATADDPGTAIFLPVAGWRINGLSIANATTGRFMTTDIISPYTNYAKGASLNFTTNANLTISTFDSDYAYNVRCVKD